MKLKPLKFVGHQIGPFGHIELNWERDSRHTLIVAENGMGKTTLVAAMAACLSFGNENLFPSEHFQRFASGNESFVYLEFVWRNLFLICRDCNQAKLAQSHIGCLKPDRENPPSYSWVNPISLKVEPRPGISEKAQQLATRTIERYGLVGQS